MSTENKVPVDETYFYGKFEMSITRLTVAESLALLTSEDDRVTTSRSRGRKSDLTPVKYRIVVEEMRKGTPLVAIAALIGKPPSQICRWLEYGERDYEATCTEFDTLDHETTDEAFNAALTYYAKFFVDVIHAAAELESELNRNFLEKATRDNEERTAIYKEQVITHADGTFSIIKVLDKEIITTSKNNDWRGTAEYLRRRFPKRWNVANRGAIETDGDESNGETTNTVSYLFGVSPAPSSTSRSSTSSPISIEQLPIFLRKLILVYVSGSRISEDLESRLTDELDNIDFDVLDITT